jgi:hypothetical protein
VNFPAGILINTQTGRFHPIVFRPAPLPGGATIGTVERYRSKGHHTTGFATRDEALAFIRERSELSLTGLALEWDGTGVPAITVFFDTAQEAAYAAAATL